jgi:nicotinamidase-related amidase
MAAKNDDLHGNVPDESDVALLLIDVINDLQFEGGERLLEQALPMTERLARLKARARAVGIPTVYVNDNFGRWRSDLRSLVAHCLQEGARGRPLVQRLLPDEQDYFVLKPKHSGFFSTTLDTLLTYLKASTLILAGITGDVCVLFTANDAYMRDFHLIVPADGCISIDPQDNAYAVRQMRRALKADVTPVAELDLEGLVRRGPAGGRRATAGLEPQVEQHAAEPDVAEAGIASARASGE